jgi:hypothetical protein
MDMNLQIENSISDIAERARDRYEDAVKAARRGTGKAAGRVTRGKKPVKTISRVGVKLSGVSHRTANKIWKRQTKLVEDQFDAVAGHLRAAAHAEDFRGLVRSQIDLIPDHTDRVKNEAREVFQIVRGAGGEIREIVKSAVDELRGVKPVARKAPARKKPATRKPRVAKPPATEEIAA